MVTTELWQSTAWPRGCESQQMLTIKCYQQLPSVIVGLGLDGHANRNQMGQLGQLQ